MARKPEPHELQQDPPEGDRDTVERELARQSERSRPDAERPAPPANDEGEG